MRTIRLASFVATALLALPCGRARGADALDRKAIEEVAVAWFRARPKTAFVAWDPKVRADLEARAKALGTIPEGTFGEVRDLLWKAVRKHAPTGNGTLPTPYGDARWIQNGKGRRQGLVLGLHGGGEGAGDASEAAGKWSLPGCIGMYPQGVRLVHDTWNTVHGERFVLTLFEIAKAQYEIDPDRVVAAGFSMGGTGSWFLAGRHPDLLAAACPCAGVLMAAPKSQVETAAEVVQLQHGMLPNVRNLAMYWFIGLADKNCMPGTYLRAWDDLLALRAKDADGYRALTFTTYPGIAHAMPPGEPGHLLDWAAKQRREATPRRVVWEQATDPYPLPEDDVDRRVGRVAKRQFYWLRCDRPADRSLVTASRDGNRIEIETVGATPADFTVLLHPKMFDPAQEVVVVSGGKELYRGRPAPDAFTMLESLDAYLDRGLVFDRRIVLDGSGRTGR